MNPARFFGECIADVFGVCNQMLDQLRQLVPDVGVLFRPILGVALALGRLMRTASVDIRRMQYLVDLIAAANRAAQQRRLLLSLEIGSRCKPTLEVVVIAAG